MKRTVVEIYALAVCFICAAVFTIFISVGLYSVLEITHPEFTMSSHDYGEHYSNEKFLEKKLRLAQENESLYSGMSPAELTAARKRSFESALEQERRSGQQSLVQSLITVFVLLLMFGMHWLIAQRARRHNIRD